MVWSRRKRDRSKCGESDCWCVVWEDRDRGRDVERGIDKEKRWGINAWIGIHTVDKDSLCTRYNEAP